MRLALLALLVPSLASADPIKQVDGKPITKGKAAAKSSVKTTLTLGTPDVSTQASTDPGLTTAQVEDAFKPKTATLRACFAKEFAKDETLVGKLVLSVEITGGRVTAASIEKTAIKSSAIDDCLVRSARLIKFPKAKATTIVHYPLDFDIDLADKLATAPKLVMIDTKSSAGAPADDGSRSSEQIAGVMKANARAVRTCYSNELAKNPKLAGKVVVDFTIKPDGSVASARVKASTLGSKAAEDCMVQAVAALKFPAANAPSTVTFPFLFTAAQ